MIGGGLEPAAIASAPIQSVRPVEDVRWGVARVGDCGRADAASATVHATCEVVSPVEGEMGGLPGAGEQDWHAPMAAV